MNMEANFPHYPEWIAYLKEEQPKTLILWGQNDSFFTPAAPESLKEAVPTAKVHYFDAGHFPQDEYAAAIAEAIVETYSVAEGPVRQTLE